MFSWVTFCGVKVMILIDTGATLSLASRRLMNKVAETFRPKLCTHDQRIVDAGGNYLRTSGKGCSQ